MEATGLTRATAIAVCEDLMDRGWIRELENLRAFGGYQKGRLSEGAACTPVRAE